VAARREAPWPAISAGTSKARPPRTSIWASALNLASSISAIAMAPKLPMRESFMTSSTRLLSPAPPKPSTASAKPSSCKAPVTSRVALIPARIDSDIGSTQAAATVTSAPMPPTMTPTSGK
jgi:hypothetical protein